MFYRNNFNLIKAINQFFYAKETITIFCPYIKLDALKKVIDNGQTCKQIVVRWEPKDIIAGVSDLEIFELCQEKGIALYWNKRIHLKVYWDGNKSAFITSANISKRALGFEFDESCNHEVGTIVDDLSIDDRIYFQKIINESIHVDWKIYSSLKKQLEGINKEQTPHDFIVDWDADNQAFLISSLPMSYDVATLKYFYFKRENLEEIAINCAIHDIALYKIPKGLSEDEFDIKLRERFLNHPFIFAFLQAIESESDGMYFGRVKEWFKNHTTTVPIPRRYELTENTQILYNWIVELTDGQYEVDVPGRRSQRIRKVK